MPQSMTGHGVGQGHANGWVAQVELSSVNHRHLDLRFRLATPSPALQARLATAVQARLGRGHVTVQLDVSRAEGAAAGVHVDKALARAWADALREVAQAAGLSGSPTPAEVAAMPGVVRLERPDDRFEELCDLVMPALEAALDGMLVSRRAEGERLLADLTPRVEALRGLHAQVLALAADLVDHRRERLRARVTDALQEHSIALDEARLEHELVLFADRTDITEELVRLQGHLDAFEDALKQDEPGRKLGFLAQELLREVNTIGSKTTDLTITGHVVEAKVEIERLREQVANIA